MKRKFLIILLTLISMICFAVMFSACGDKGNVNDTVNNSSVTDQTGDSNDNVSGNNSETPKNPDSGTGSSGGTDSGTEKPAPHVHSYGNWEIISPATHTTAGTRRKYCSCGEYVDETIPKTTEHEYGNWKTTREATHLVAGEKQRTCTCGKVETEVIPKTTEHTFLPYSHKDATCTEAGEDVLRCECGAEKRNIISPSHTYDHCECTVCGAIKPGAIAVEVHVDDRLYDTVYTDAEYGYKIELPTVPPDWKVDKSILCYFDGWYTDKDYTTLATGDEVYNAPSAIYSRQYINDKWSCDCTFSNNEATITRVNLNYGTTIFIPRYINTFPVTGIAANAFKGQTTIRYLFLSDNLRTIGEGAFEGCNSMLKVFFSEGLKSIERYAFWGCTSLTSITIPTSVTSIGSSAFYNCRSLTGAYITDLAAWCNIEFNDNPLEYAHNLYLNDELVTDITADMLQGVTEIKDYAFNGYTSLKSIAIPDSVTSIDGSAFYGCTSLESITLPFIGNGSSKTHLGYIFGASSYSDNSSYVPSSLKTVIIMGGGSINSYAFYNCKKLENITIPDSVTSIGGHAFYNCTNLTGVYITNLKAWCNIEFGNEYANPLYYANNLYLNDKLVTDITADMLQGVTEIKGYAFYGCTSLKSIEIPESVTSIGKEAFYNCRSLTGVYVTDLAAWCNIEFSGYEANPLCYAHKLYLNNELITEITADMLQGVTEIKARAFYYCTSIKSITIPNSTTYIGDGVFRDCTSLTSITIPDSVTSIEDYVFYYCTSLTSITIPDKVHSIGEYAFYDCYRLESVTIGSGVTYIASYAFAYCGLKSIEIPDNVEQMSNYSFYGSSLQSVTISSGVKKIGWYSFGNCSKLESVIFESTSNWGLLDNSGTGNYRYTITVTNNTANNAKLFTNTYVAYYWCRLN